MSLTGARAEYQYGLSAILPWAIAASHSLTAQRIFNVSFSVFAFTGSGCGNRHMSFAQAGNTLAGNTLAGNILAGNRRHQQREILR
jgi:hypothetical protein